MIPLIVLFIVSAFYGTLLYTHRTLQRGPDISATVIADSVHVLTGSRVTTLVLKYPRFIHSELMTHRLFARNASSSRAVPVSRTLRDVLLQMAMPSVWGENKPGMQAGADLGAVRRGFAAWAWCSLGLFAVLASRVLAALGAHKQIANRVTEPWSHITVVVTASQHGWRNFLYLRKHPAADPTMFALAREVERELKLSTPRVLSPGQWHLPFVSRAETTELGYSVAVRVSTARCARVSYLKHDGTPAPVNEDLDLFDRLLKDSPKHASPAEHQVRAAKIGESSTPAMSGCLQDKSWIMHRLTIASESVFSWTGDDGYTEV